MASGVAASGHHLHDGGGRSLWLGLQLGLAAKLVDGENGSMTRCSLYPLELFINLSVELAKRIYAYGT
eukprot:SAG22_NODE_389_length_11276_cov_12.397244_8_plen_67_part_01